MRNSREDIPPEECPEMIALIKNMSIAERALRTFKLCQMVDELVMEGIKLRNPGLSGEEYRRLFREHRMSEYRRAGQLLE